MWNQAFSFRHDITASLCGLYLAWTGQSFAASLDITLNASDGQQVFGTLTTVHEHNPRIVLLFHQAGANRHEYDPIVPAVNALGFDTLAIDQRAGGTRFGYPNQTVSAAGNSGTYLQAYKDLKGTVAWAETQQYKTIVSVGSSYSSSLNILLAGDFPQTIDAIACFSPGEYIDGKPDLIKQGAALVKQPFYITTPPAEDARVDEVLSATHGDNVLRYRQQVGVHGASTLVQERNPDGYQANLADFKVFLSRFGPSSQ